MALPFHIFKTERVWMDLSGSVRESDFGAQFRVLDKVKGKAVPVTVREGP
jgi:hypothetical protein